jgi:hypothetical protein
MEVAIGILAEIGALLGSCERELHVAAPQGGGRAAHQVPNERVRVAQQAGCLDAPFEQLARLDQLPALAQEPAEGCGQQQEELSLAGRARHRQRASCVCLALGVAVQVELHPGEPGRSLEMAGKVVVRQGIDQRRRLGTTRVGFGGCPQDRIREGELGKRRRDQRRVSKPPRGAH